MNRNGNKIKKKSLLLVAAIIFLMSDVKSGAVSDEIEIGINLEDGEITYGKSWIYSEDESTSEEHEDISGKSETEDTESEDIFGESETGDAESENISGESETGDAESEEISGESETGDAESGNIPGESETGDVESEEISRESETGDAESEEISGESETGETEIQIDLHEFEVAWTRVTSLSELSEKAASQENSETEKTEVEETESGDGFLKVEKAESRDGSLKVEERKSGESDSDGKEADGKQQTEEDAEMNGIRYLAGMPEGFRYPMVLSESELSQKPERVYYELEDIWRLHGLHPVFLNGEKDIDEWQRLSMDTLQKKLENLISGFDGDWSVYVKNLKTDESILLNDRPMKSASVMKLFIMGTVYTAIEKNELERTEEVVNCLNNMISVSDNEASNRLLYLLGDSSYEKGIEKVNDFVEEYGFSELTREYNGFNSSAATFDNDHFNQVSAKDCGKLLEDVYRRRWISRTVCNEIEQMMLNQHTRYKIPAGLPEGVQVGNKTGEMDTTENDAAVIYGQNCDYILVVLSSDWSSKDQAIGRIAQISEMVYTHLNS